MEERRELGHPTSVGDEIAAEKAALTPQLRRYFLGVSGSFIGNGFVIGLYVVYLHSVRHLSQFDAGLVLSFQALIAFPVGLLSGSIVDRVGPRPVLLTGAGVNCVAVSSIAFITSFPTALLVAFGLAVGGALVWGPSSTYLARLAGEQHRERVFGLHFMLINFGLGIGALVGALIVNKENPATFQLCYILDGLTYLVFFAVLLTLPSGAAAPDQIDPSDKGQGYASLLRDRRLRVLVFGAVILLTCSYGSLESGFSAYVSTVGGLSTHWISIIFAANTACIVIFQLFVLSRLQGRSRARLLGLVGTIWAMSWLLAAVSATLPATVAGVGFALGLVIFAVGETIWAPVFPTLINALAPEHLRGRYNSITPLLWGSSAFLAPFISGSMLGTSYARLWPVVVAGGCLCGGAILTTISRGLSDTEDGVAAGT